MVWTEQEDVVGRKIKIGVCVMEKKVLSAPMLEILDRLQSFGEFEIIRFGDKVIVDDPVESWPICDCLIAFYSSGYPLKKAQAYATLRKPYLVNDLGPQHLLHDRRKVYERLEMYGIPVPRYALVNREKPYQELDYFIEEEDFVEVHGNRFWKPFVEKPVDGDDHSIMIYYPSSAGGGMKELFRKVGNRSSEFRPDVRRVRREGSYIYEEFMPTGGTDVKVYTVGSEYAHAEARKSPVVDGVVMRNPDGKEVRYPVLLTPGEKQMAREVCIAFRQAVCGFDLLRCEGQSYVCDVNGWSFVKNSYKYYDDAACVLRKMFLDAKAPHLSTTIPPNLPWKVNEPVQPCEGLTRQGSGSIGMFGQSEELHCVIAVIRHGDRTPKQKVKLKVTEEKLLNLMLKYNGGRPRSETKLKTAVELQDLLDATRILVPRIRPDRESDSEAEDIEHAEKLRQVRAVLEEGGHFSGIYRKVQLKPSKWIKVVKSNGEGEEERPVEALMVLKYGGVLTHAGRKQAEELGRYFRNNMYPGEGTGLLRLHSTYRHDLKIYSSDEGRVQMSAAAFAKGLLDLEGQLTPILVSLVSKDSSMLDGLDNASIEMDEAKARLHEIISSEVEAACRSSEQPWMVDGAGLPSNADKLLSDLVALTKKVTEQVRLLARNEDEDETLGESNSYGVIPAYDQAKALGKTSIDVDRIASGLPCGSEGFLLMFARWRKLERDLYNERKGRFDITQIPDVYDSSKYDILHNAHLNLKGLDELFKVAQLLADGVIPNEYGINPKQKLKIGSKIARRLLGKILIDLRNTREEAIEVSGLKSRQENQLTAGITPIEDTDVSSNTRRTSFTEEMSIKQEENDGKETKYRLDPKYANVRTPERHVRTRLYFTSESHIHSLMNVLRYCNLDESLQEEASLVSDNALDRLFKTKELDYMSYIVLRMFENTAVSSLDDPKRFRIELTFSRGADLSPLQDNNVEAASLRQEHTLPIMGPERLQEVGSYLTLEKMEKMLQPFAMPAEDFPPPSTPQGFSGYFSKSAAVLERLANIWPFHHKHGRNGKTLNTILNDEDNNSNNTRRQLKGKQYKGPCTSTNPIDRCWRCQPNWANNRKRLADCALGFGRGTIGGKNGELYVVTDPSDNSLINPSPGTLRHAVIQEKPLWIIFSRSMSIRLAQELIMQSDKTIDGRGVYVHIANGAGITLQYIQNVIIHGIHVHNIFSGNGGMIRDSVDHYGFRTQSDGDGISIFGSSKIWIDHVSMSHCTDGIIDAVEASTAITISNSHFTDHNEVMLFGASDSYTKDTSMQITLAYNHFGKRLVQRMPRCRLGYIHVVNNDYTHWEMYAIGGSKNPTIISQGNRFIAPPNPFAKEVTKRDYAPESVWKSWDWISDNDYFLNGAFFVPSGDPDYIKKHAKMLDNMIASSGRQVDIITKFAGALNCKTGAPC